MKRCNEPWGSYGIVRQVSMAALSYHSLFFRYRPVSISGKMSTLVILTHTQLLLPHTVCQNCLLADQQGLPRWRQGQLCCAQPIPENLPQNSRQFRCKMGFRLAEVEDVNSRCGGSR
jgi:hypothetical protein